MAYKIIKTENIFGTYAFFFFFQENDNENCKNCSSFRYDINALVKHQRTRLVTQFKKGNILSYHKSEIKSFSTLPLC